MAAIFPITGKTITGGAPQEGVAPIVIAIATTYVLALNHKVEVVAY